MWYITVAQTVKRLSAMQETRVQPPGLGRSPGEGKGYPLQYTGLENSMDCSPWGREVSDTTERLSLSSHKLLISRKLILEKS